MKKIFQRQKIYRGRLTVILVCALILTCIGVFAIIESPSKNHHLSIASKMLVEWENGRINDTAYFADSSADYLAHYLTAYTHGRSFLGRTKTLKQTHSILESLVAKSVTSDNCRGWGLNAPYDAFLDDTINGADTAYLYTSGVVISALLKAEARRLFTLEDAFLNEIKCMMENGFVLEKNPFNLRYSNHSHDNGYLVYPSLTYYAEASLLLSERLESPILKENARFVCDKLFSSVLPDGKTAYRRTKQYFSMIHHAQTINGLVVCADAFDFATDNIMRALDVVLAELDNAQSKQLAIHPELNWHFGETLIALKNGCKLDEKYCAAVSSLTEMLVTGFKEGAIYDRNPRSQAWIASSLFYKAERQGLLNYLRYLFF